MNIRWREKLIAAAIHFLVTLSVSALAAALIFLVWFPGALAEMVGGERLFFLVAGVDIVLGPMISLVIYSTTKSRGKLIFDYIVIGTLQLSAVCYGLSVVAKSRPVFVVFDGDRFEIVAALEIAPSDLALGSEPRFQTLSWTGPRLAMREQPKNEKERSDQLFAEIEGRAFYLQPKYYRDFALAREQVLAQSRTTDSLLQDSGSNRAKLEEGIAQAQAESQSVRWISVHTRFQFGVALVDAKTATPLKYLAIDPEWVKP